MINLIQIESGERVTAVRAVKEFPEDRYLFMATKHGVVKKTKLSEFDTRLKGGLIAIGLANEDELQWVVETDGSREILIVTEHGMSIRFPEEQVRFMGRTAAGVRGINLRNGDAVVGMGVVREDCAVLVATREGYGKRTNASEYRSQSRGGKGIKTLNVTPKNGPLVGMRIVSNDDELLIMTTAGQMIRQTVSAIRQIGRSTQGVRLIRLDENDHVASIARIVTQEEE